MKGAPVSMNLSIYVLLYFAFALNAYLVHSRATEKVLYVYPQNDTSAPQTPTSAPQKPTSAPKKATLVRKAVKRDDHDVPVATLDLENSSDYDEVTANLVSDHYNVHNDEATESSVDSLYSLDNHTKQFVGDLEFSPEIHVHFRQNDDDDDDDNDDNCNDCGDDDCDNCDDNCDDCNDHCDDCDDNCDNCDDEVVDIVQVDDGNAQDRAPAFFQLRRILRFIGRIIYFKIFIKMAILSYAMLFLPRMNLYSIFQAIGGYEVDAEQEEDYDDMLNADDGDDDDDDGGDTNIDFSPDLDFDNDLDLDINTNNGDDDDDDDDDNDDDGRVLVRRRRVRNRSRTRVRNRIRRVRRRRRRGNGRRRNGLRRTGGQNRRKFTVKKAKKRARINAGKYGKVTPR